MEDRQFETKNLWKERSVFLKDVLACSLGAYGGPEAHISVFLDILVVKKNYLNEAELIELVALCSILPGPTSTQTIVAVGYKLGGTALALLTMLVWALPVLLVMTVLSFLYRFLEIFEIPFAVLRYIGPMAVGFILLAAYRIGRKVVVDVMTASLMIGAAIITWFIRTPWIYPVVLCVGGIVSLLYSKEKDVWNRVDVQPPWRYFFAFAGFAIGLIILSMLFESRLLQLFENFYRYGYLVFGGGQVVVPVMHSELVGAHGYMDNQEFLTGYGLVQGLPGPMFSFAAYAGGMAARGSGVLYQIFGAIAGGVGIFLPGLLLIFFVYPVWEQLKSIKGVRIALRGIGAVAGGLIAVAAFILVEKSGLQMDYLLVTVVSVVLLASRKIPAPLIVLGTLVLGIAML